jgi:hypothetical protein
MISIYQINHVLLEVAFMIQNIDYLNDIFLHNPLLFYEEIYSIDHLVEFSMKRPDPEINIYHRPGDKDVAIVVPTSNINGKYAIQTSKIFERFSQFFVVSSGKYFNYSKSVNAGIKAALEISPRFIILANDDIYEIDSINLLIKKLRIIDENKVDYILVDPEPDYYHSYTFYMTNIKLYFKKLLYILKNYYTVAKILTELSDKFGIVFYKEPVAAKFKLDNLQYFSLREKKK